MKRLSVYILWIFVLFGSFWGCGSKPEADEVTQYFDAGWANRNYWDDGLAEVATYAAERVIYDKVRTYDYTLITVKEDFNKAFNVKTDDYKRTDLFPVMKVNQFCRIPTENYPYHFMTSLFFKRDQPVFVHKLTSSSQEWCGTTFKAIQNTGQEFEYSYNSYWDEQGTGNMELQNTLLFEDQLPYTLRSLKFKEGLTFKAEVSELLQTSKATKPTIYEAAFVINEDQKIPAGAWRVTVILSPEKQNQYWFRKEYPNILIGQQTWDGRKLELKENKRQAYWKH